MARFSQFRVIAGAMALALAALLGLAAGSNARADDIGSTTAEVVPYPIVEGALFNRPPDAGGTPEQELAWNSVIEHLLDATPAGATVTGSLFSLTGIGAQEALKRAHERGVKVRMLLYDRRADEPRVRALVRVLNNGKTPGSWAKVCRGSCYGRRTGNLGVQHFKAFTFSAVMETDTQLTTNVWTAGSGNLTNRGSGFNSFVIKKDDPKIVAAFNSYLVGMRADKESRPTTTRMVQEGPYKIYLYPQRKLTPDVVYDNLKHTDCKAPAGYGRNGRTVVRVGMFAWTPYRNLDDQLVRLRKAGCDVRVIVSKSYVDKRVLKQLIRAKVPVRDAYVKHGGTFYYLHDKNVIIDGVISGRPVKQVLTGSNNFTDGGLTRNTESIIRIRDTMITEQFLANWSVIEGYAKPITRVSSSSDEPVMPVDAEELEAAG